MVRVTFLLVAICIAICRATEVADSAETFGTPNIISRQQWGARPPKSTIPALKIDPVPYVVIHHSDTVGCNTQAICQARVRSFQVTLMIYSFYFFWFLFTKMSDNVTKLLLE
ncbi:peptidoglycan recognition protein 3-like [Vespula maculifrons]|uniref:Peptidoglycan recognition protein 3-like n=1 Tax=Vespula maculifrons TaxID=7453 RepID=A0ABD2D0N0_VESMC